MPLFLHRLYGSRIKIHGLLRMLLAVFLLLPLALPDDSDAKRKKRRRVQPPLKILSIAMTPDQYVAGHGALTLAIDVAIPKGADGSTLLEVSSLISSPSKRVVRFLTIRKPLLEKPDHAHMGEGEYFEGTLPEHATQNRPPPTQSNDTPDRMRVHLLWDGTDQNKEVVPSGRYEYAIRAKLLALEDNGPKTQMVSWRKKGSLIVHAAPPEAKTDPK